MNLQQMLNGLHADEPKTRFQTAQIIGTLDEVAALEVLAAQANTETDAKVKEVIYWAGKRVFEAKKSGYSTLEAIIQYFHIDYEFAAPTTSGDDTNMQRIKTEMEMRALREEEESARRQAASKLMAGTFLTLPGLMLSRPTMPQAVQNLDASFDKHLSAKKSRTLPTKPSDGDIKILVNRLFDDAKNDKRVGAAVDLAAVVNNPAALPYLAQAFIKDYALQVREAAQRSAKLIYWNVIYWEMEQDGSMAAEIEKRRGTPPPLTQAQTPTPPPATPAQPSVDEILRKAEAARRKRK